MKKIIRFLLLNCLGITVIQILQGSEFEIIWNKTTFPVYLSDDTMLSQIDATNKGNILWQGMNEYDKQSWIITIQDVLYVIDLAKQNFYTNWVGSNPQNRTTLEAIGLKSKDSEHYLAINTPNSNAPEGSCEGMWFYTNLCIYTYLTTTEDESTRNGAQKIVDQLLSLVAPTKVINEPTNQYVAFDYLPTKDDITNILMLIEAYEKQSIVMQKLHTLITTTNTQTISLNSSTVASFLRLLEIHKNEKDLIEKLRALITTMQNSIKEWHQDTVQLLLTQ